MNHKHTTISMFNHCDIRSCQMPMCLNLFICSVKAYEDDDDDEEWETGKRNAKRISDGYDDGYDNYDNYGEGWNNGDQMPDWDNQGYDNFHSNGTEVRKVT